jgi:hypothetical protein
MDLEVRWKSPLKLFKSKANFIYEVENFDTISNGPGVYVFARGHGASVSPLYVGKAINLQTRIGQQLNTTKLMRAIENAANGSRVLYVAEFIGKGGQNPNRAIDIVESAFISAALAKNSELINVKRTKTTSHSVTSSGNMEARSWHPKTVIQVRKTT